MWQGATYRINGNSSFSWTWWSMFWLTILTYVEVVFARLVMMRIASLSYHYVRCKVVIWQGATYRINGNSSFPWTWWSMFWLTILTYVEVMFACLVMTWIASLSVIMFKAKWLLDREKRKTVYVESGLPVVGNQVIGWPYPRVSPKRRPVRPPMITHAFWVSTQLVCSWTARIRPHVSLPHLCRDES